jgi:hypothetical protein
MSNRKSQLHREFGPRPVAMHAFYHKFFHSAVDKVVDAEAIVEQGVDAPVFDVISPIFSESIIKCMSRVPEKE